MGVKATGPRFRSCKEDSPCAAPQARPGGSGARGPGKQSGIEKSVKFRGPGRGFEEYPPSCTEAQSFGIEAVYHVGRNLRKPEFRPAALALEALQPVY